MPTNRELLRTATLFRCTAQTECIQTSEKNTPDMSGYTRRLHTYHRYFIIIWPVINDDSSFTNSLVIRVAAGYLHERGNVFVHVVLCISLSL